jgi:RNA polymerase sigma factor (sigma-70 family)
MSFSDSLKKRNAFITKIYSEDEYYKIVNDTLRYLLPGINHADLEDCIEEVYQIALKTEGIETHPKIHGWLNLTAKNVAKKFKERQILLTKLNRLTEVPENLADPDNFMDKIEEQEFDDEFLEKIKAFLNGQEYILFDLKFLQNKSSEEIADETELTKRAVDMRITRIKKKLQKFLKKP